MSKIDIIGRKVGRYVVVEKSNEQYQERPNSKEYKFVCKCDCGTTFLARRDVIMRAFTKSCGCLVKEAAKKAGVTRTLSGNTAQKNDLYGAYKRNAISRGLLFTISKEDFQSLIEKPCHYCGLEKSNCRKHRSADPSMNYYYNGIDRLKSSVGYQLDNLVPCCNFCNTAKLDLSKPEFLENIFRIYLFQQKEKQ